MSTNITTDISDNTVLDLSDAKALLESVQDLWTAVFQNGDLKYLEQHANFSSNYHYNGSSSTLKGLKGWCKRLKHYYEQRSITFNEAACSVTEQFGKPVVVLWWTFSGVHGGTQVTTGGVNVLTFEVVDGKTEVVYNIEAVENPDVFSVLY